MLENLLGELRAYSKIIVTGPQRSGTRIAAKIIANEIGHEFIDEVEFGIHKARNFFKLLEENRNIVIQAPAMSAICHLIDGPDVAIVFMMRPLDEILQSQTRIGWGVPGGPLSSAEEIEVASYFRSGPAAQIKYEIWQEWQKRMARAAAFELPYHELQKSRLWVDPENRKAFLWYQTE